MGISKPHTDKRRKPLKGAPWHPTRINDPSAVESVLNELEREREPIASHTRTSLCPDRSVRPQRMSKWRAGWLSLGSGLCTAHLAALLWWLGTVQLGLSATPYVFGATLLGCAFVFWRECGRPQRLYGAAGPRMALEARNRSPESSAESNSALPVEPRSEWSAAFRPVAWVVAVVAIPVQVIGIGYILVAGAVNSATGTSAGDSGGCIGLAVPLLAFAVFGCVRLWVLLWRTRWVGTRLDEGAHQPTTLPK